MSSFPLSPAAARAPARTAGKNPPRKPRVTGLLADRLFALLAHGAAWLTLAALVGILTQAFSGLVGLIALIPWLGPLVIKALSIPLVWILNGAGYFFSVVLAGRGYGKSVVQSRILTVVLIVGIVIGFIIGKLVS